MDLFSAHKTIMTKYVMLKEDRVVFYAFNLSNLILDCTYIKVNKFMKI